MYPKKLTLSAMLPAKIWRIPIVFVLILCNPFPALAELTPVPEIIQAPATFPEIEAGGWILVDYDTGWILGGHNADNRIEPASLTKLMTSYLVFEALETGALALEDEVYISEKAWRTEGSRMFVQVDTRVSVVELLQGLIIQSGNDAAVALAEHLSGSEEGFAARMNQKAAELGMVNTRFHNSHGLPADNHYSTAADMVLLSASLIRRFPDLYRYYSEREYTYNEITQHNRNLLLGRDPTVDGIKTGYTKKAGYCLIGTAVRDDVRLLAAVVGSTSKTLRADQVQSLLRFGYDAYERATVFKQGAQIKSLRLWMGETPQASIGVNQDVQIIVPTGQENRLSATLELPDSLEAPLSADTMVGHFQLAFDGEPVHRGTLHVNETYREGSWFSRILDHLRKRTY
ncbi:MAG: D-alanyl-D-alanine carboxypeptidase [Gammaproteobacteria bacterium]|nr:D-alanyl-D-alanine carboxypeptidase [Gammaproteobacteria bacterium]